MAKLPFVVQPKLKPIGERIGTDESGVIEIERRGYLTGAEKTFVQQVQQQDGGTLQLVALSRRIAKEKKLALDKAYNVIVTILTGEATGKLAAEIESEYAEDIQRAVNGIAAARSKEDLINAACLLIHRVDPTIDISDVVELHPDLIAGLSALYREEDLKSIEKLTQDQTGSSDSEGDEKAAEINVDEIEKKQETQEVQ
jgi:hypothetical protein